MSPTAPPRAEGESPFRESRLNTSRDFRPEWDVPSLNQAVSASLVGQVMRLEGRREPDPGQLIPVLVSSAGYGKTHLFGRIADALGEKAFFVFVDAIADPTRPLEHIRWHVVESLFRARQGKPPMLAQALSELFHPSIVEYVRQLPPAQATRHEALRRALQEGTDRVLEIASRVQALRPYLRLADSLAESMPELQASVLRALVLGWSPKGHLARRWLRGESLPEEETAALNLDEEPPSPLRVLQGVVALLRYRRPMVICCDQLDSVLKSPEGPRQLAIQLIEILAGVPNQFIILSCLEASWVHLVKNSAFESFTQRTRLEKLDVLTPVQALELVRKRLHDWPGARPESGEVWPFDRQSIINYAEKKEPAPRAFIQRCATKFDEWLDGRNGELIDVEREDTMVPPDRSFQLEWERQLQLIRQDPARTPNQTEEARLYEAVKETLLLAKLAGRDFAGARVMAAQEGFVPQGGSVKRYSLKVDLAARDKAHSVVVVVTKVNQANLFSHYYRAVKQVAEATDGVLLIHPRAEFATGATTAREIEKDTARARYLHFALEDYPETFQRLECARSLLEKAHSGDLQLAGESVSFDQCRELILKARVIDQLDLFKTLADWGAASEAAGEAVTGGAAAESKADAKDAARAAAPPETPAPPHAPPAPVAPQPAPPAGDAVEAWAREKLARAVEKLTAWGQKVEPAGFEVGPSFVRLKVRPVGAKTRFKLVCNRVNDLKTQLGLDVVPIISSQPYHYAIDVQSPWRKAVTLREAMAHPPAGNPSDPAFPLGLDVAGKAHWLNLADPSDCHLLVAGTTGSGKSEFLKSLLASLAGRLGPEQIKFILIDPKRVTFNFSGPSPYLLHPVAYDLAAALPLVRACQEETLRRYDLLQSLQKSDVGQLDGEQASLVPRLVLVIDEFANLMDDTEANKALTALLKQIGSMSRAAGIHLVLATQRPDKDVVPVLVRANLPGKIALRVDSEANSQLILDAPDAAYLLGMGDLLCKRGGSLTRVQGPLVPREEMEQLLRIPAP